MSEHLTFPRWVHCADGASRIAPNRHQYDAFMSIEGPKVEPAVMAEPDPDPPLAVVPEPEPILDAPVADSKKTKTKKADPKPVEDPAGIFAKE